MCLLSLSIWAGYESLRVSFCELRPVYQGSPPKGLCFHPKTSADMYRELDAPSTPVAGPPTRKADMSDISALAGEPAPRQYARDAGWSAPHRYLNGGLGTPVASRRVRRVARIYPHNIGDVPKISTVKRRPNFRNLREEMAKSNIWVGRHKAKQTGNVSSLISVGVRSVSCLRLARAPRIAAQRRRAVFLKTWAA